MNLDSISTSLEGIAHVLSNYYLRVPTFQRSYAWEKSNVMDLLQDIAESIRVGANEYFLGSVVVSTETPTFLEVIDGQQRLATITILLASIRDYFLEIGEEDRAKSLEDDYLLKRDLRTQEAKPKLTLNEIDREFFQGSILEHQKTQGKASKTAKASHQLISDAAKTTSTYLRTSANISKNPIDHLIDIVEFVNTKAKVIIVKVPDHSNAFTIFETLNDRGIDLAISDLLKNYLFFKSGDRITEVQRSWTSMQGALTVLSYDTSIVEYIRHYWSSKNGATREKDLYASIRKKISSKQSAINFALGLESAARNYAAILSPAHEYWAELGTTVRHDIHTINLLRMVQVRPLLLAIVEKFSNAEVRKALKLVVSFGVRFLVHGGLGGGVLEANYCKYAQAIYSGKIKTTKELGKNMAAIIPTDKAFETAFSSATIAQAYLARYYLRVLENQKRSQEESELVPNSNEEEITLEHVLPLKPESNWPEFDEESAKTYQKRLGNMVLLKKRINSSLRSSSFKKKRSTFLESDYILTSEVGENLNWNAEEIVARQDRLAKLAVKAWAIK